jgi:transcriptional regulator with XRE-family HTH domain
MALSQGEVAFLLGQGKSSHISRYERSEHVPNLEAALAYEVIFKSPLSEIFGGLYQKVEQEVAERARILASRTEGGDSEANIAKREMFAELGAIKN